MAARPKFGKEMVCATCAFFHPEEYAARDGQCRNRPPTLVWYNDSDDEHSHWSYWPEVRLSEWCGKWSGHAD